MGTPPNQIPLINGSPYGQTGGLAPGSVPSFDGVSVLGGTAMRNRILNGDLRIDQALAGAALVVNAAAYGFGPDKFKGFGTGAAGVFSLQQQNATPPAGFTNYLRATVTTPDAAPAAGSIYIIEHDIEGTYLQDFGWGAAGAQKAALGIWVRSSILGTFSACLENAAQNRSQVIQFAIAAVNTWQFVPLIFIGDVAGVWLKTAGVGVRVIINLGSGVNFQTGTTGAWVATTSFGATTDTKFISTNGATFDYTGFQLEPGSGCTNFEQRPLGDMIRLCMREFFKTFSPATAPASNVGINTGEIIIAAARAGALADVFQVRYPVQMRTAANVLSFNPAAVNGLVRDETAGVDGSGFTFLSNTVDGFSATANGNAVTVVGNILGVHLTVDARL